MTIYTIYRLAKTLLFSTLALFANKSNAEQSMNDYVLSAVDFMALNLANRGYEINSSFTEQLSYGTEKISPTNEGKTMCVAAVAEVMIRAINNYANFNNTTAPFEKLPATHWKKGTLTSLRAHLYQYSAAKSYGPGDALSRIGIGEKIDFDKLIPGDFLAFSRKNSGHSVVFLGFIDKKGNIINIFNQGKIAGFKYLSSQGIGLPNAGIGYRNAYFATNTPRSCNRLIEDCGVLNVKTYLNGGRLWIPEKWDTKYAIQKLREEYISKIKKSNPEITRDAVELVVDGKFLEELAESYSVKFEGVENE